MLNRVGFKKNIKNVLHDKMFLHEKRDFLIKIFVCFLQKVMSNCDEVGTLSSFRHLVKEISLSGLSSVHIEH